MGYELSIEEKLQLEEELNTINIRLATIDGDYDDFFEIAQRCLVPVFKKLKIAKATISMKAPKTVLAPEGLFGSEILCDTGDLPGPNEHEEAHDTKEGGVSIVTYFPKVGYEFGDYELDKLKYISDLVYAWGGRIRVRGLLDKSLSSDGMTGLPNLKTVLGFVNMLIRRGRVGYYNAYYINVRNFQYVNKISTRMGGDKAMTMYAGRLSSLADRDEMIGRIGGDNFIAIIKRVENDAFLEGLKAITIDVETPSGLRSVTLSAVAGIYELPRELIEPESIMMPISMANSMAKQVLHRDYVYYNEEIAQNVIGSQRVLIDFESSLAKHEFEAFLQPKIDLTTGEVCGAEALARWNHEGEVIPPDVFIPPLERDGTICRLDFEILRQTCDILQNWVDNGQKTVKVSVNLSRWHLEEPRTFDHILSIVSEYNFGHELLEFELTETVDSKEYDSMTRLLQNLRNEGFTTSIDDFGTGYSSITMLKDFKLDVLKLDRSFIMKIGTPTEGSKDRVLISNIISLAKQLDMKVLAEGVETMDQLEYLKMVGCDMVQGFYYSEPLRATEFSEKYA